MNTPRTIDDVMNEMNALAQAQGKHLGKAFWEIPRESGSLLDVPDSPESRERIAKLRARRLERAKSAETTLAVVQDIQNATRIGAPLQQPDEKAAG